MLAVFADAKLRGLVPSFEIAVGEDREILELAVARLAFFGAAEDLSLAKCVGFEQKRQYTADNSSRSDVF